MSLVANSGHFYTVRKIRTRLSVRKNATTTQSQSGDIRRSVWGPSIVRGNRREFRVDVLYICYYFKIDTVTTVTVRLGFIENLIEYRAPYVLLAESYCRGHVNGSRTNSPDASIKR